MFLDSLTSPLTASSTSVTTTSPHESTTHVSSSSSRSETGVITSSGSNIPDIISLDWRRTHSIVGVIRQNCTFLDLWSVEAIFLVKITLIFIEMSSGFFCLLRDEHRWLQQEPDDMQGFFLLVLYSEHQIHSAIIVSSGEMDSSCMLLDGFHKLKIFVVISSNKIM